MIKFISLIKFKLCHGIHWIEQKLSINKASSMTSKLILKNFLQEEKYALKKNIYIDETALI